MFLYMERNKYFSSLLNSICKGLNSFFSSETQKKICPMILLVEDILLIEIDVKKLA